MGYLTVIWPRLDRTRDRNGARKGSGPAASARRIRRALIKAGNIPAQSRVLVLVSPQLPQSSSRTVKGIKALVLTVSLSSPRLLMMPPSMYLASSGHQFTGKTGTVSPAPSDNSCWFALLFRKFEVNFEVGRSRRSARCACCRRQRCWPPPRCRACSRTSCFSQTRSPTRSSNAFLAAPVHPTHLTLPRFVDVPSAAPRHAGRLSRLLLAA